MKEDPSLAFGIAAFFLALTFVEGHFITPAVVGRRMTMNPLAVFMALAFWTWMWGPIGAFLAVPLLIVGMVILRHTLAEDLPELPE